MSLFDRLKRLWELSGTEPAEMPAEWVAFLEHQTKHPPLIATSTAVIEAPIEPGEIRVLKPKGPATIVEMEAPFDAFEGQDKDHEGDIT